MIAYISVNLSHSAFHFKKLRLCIKGCGVVRKSSFYIIHQLLLRSEITGKIAVFQSVIIKLLRPVGIACAAGICVQLLGVDEQRNNASLCKIVNSSGTFFSRQ
ncbi:hypothetical protein D3C75_897990 [compost metagenome]